MRGVVVRAGDPVVVAVAQRGVVGPEPVFPRLVYSLCFGTLESDSDYNFLNIIQFHSWFGWVKTVTWPSVIFMGASGGAMAAAAELTSFNFGW